MRSDPRTRHYVSPNRLTILRPLLGYDDLRDAYTLRAFGDRIGPVMRADRRHDHALIYTGPERRGALRSWPARGSGGWAPPR